MNAYAETYLNDAMEILGEAFEYAVFNCKKDIDDFMGLFIATGTADQFGSGNPKYIAGMSGIELVLAVFRKANLTVDPIQCPISYIRSPYYWAGWILAYYQWKTGRTFREINEYMQVSQILLYYPTLHEAHEDKFVETAELARMEKKTSKSKLQMYRRLMGYSQSMLAKVSGVNLRTLQQYELGTKDLSKASVSTVIVLSRALNCSIEELIDSEQKVV